jgi:plasmid rolling circle replication initiator protein Rep
MTNKEKPLRNKAVEADITNKGSDDTTIQARLAQFNQAKERQGVIINHLEGISKAKKKSPLHGFIDPLKLTAQMKDCFNYLLFHDYYTVGQNRLIRATSCKKHLLCAPCAIRRASKSVVGYLDKFKEIMVKNDHLTPYMLTLTVRNGESLVERFNHLQNSMKKILKSRRDSARKNTGFNEFCKIEGAVYSYELTFSKKHGWHPHIHIIVLQKKDNLIDFNPKNPKESRLSKDWARITKDSFIVDCRPIYGDPVQGFIEVFKYALKFSDLTPEQTIEAYSYLQGKRLQGSFGLFRGVIIDKSMNENPLDGLPYMELFYKYSAKNFTLAWHKHIEV